MKASITILLSLAARPHARLHAALELDSPRFLSRSHFDHAHRLLVDMVSETFFSQSSCSFLCIHVDAAVVTNDRSFLLGRHNLITFHVLLTLSEVALAIGVFRHFRGNGLLRLLEWRVSLG